MPRRFYDSVAESKVAVPHALRLLGAVNVQYLLGDTRLKQGLSGSVEFHDGC